MSYQSQRTVSDAWKVILAGGSTLVVLVYLATEALMPRRPLDTGPFQLAFNILATIGTVSAVVVALWVARQSERIASSRALNLARAVGVRRFADLLRLEHLVTTHLDNISSANVPDRSAAELILIAALGQRIATFSDEFLATLCPLDERLVGKLAQGLSMASIAADQAALVRSWAEAGGEEAAKLIYADREMIGVCILSLLAARDLLREFNTQLTNLLDLPELRPPGWESGPPPLRPAPR